MKRWVFAAGLIGMILALVIWRLRPLASALPPKPRTVEDVMNAVGPTVDARLQGDFARAQVPYPPRSVTLVAFKREKRLEVHAKDDQGRSRHVRSYPIQAASGGEGPKLREGDGQVPEGFYRIELLNPNSRYHLSLRVNYPNAEDRARARADGRSLSGLGGDIMIHGGAASIGCLAMGDPAAEDLFVLAARTGLDHLDLVIVPRDLRRIPATENDTPHEELYDRLRKALQKFSEQP